MKILYGALLAFFLTIPNTSGARAEILHRSKAGPVTIRGVAVNVTSHAFDLRSPSKGTYHVLVSPATSVIEKGVSGKVTLRNDDHVGVRGFVRGRSMTAMSIRVYPLKPKAFDVRGSVVSIRGSQLTVRAGAHTYRIAVTPQTSVRIGSAQGTAGQIHVGDRTQVRVQPGNRGLTAVHVRVYRQRSAGRHVQIRGTVQSVAPGSLHLSSGKTVVSVRVTSSTKFYAGTDSTTFRALKAGQIVRVYACCAGGTLTATSVHIERSASHITTMLLHGRVAALSATTVTLVSGNQKLTVTLDTTTSYQVGSQPVGRTGMRIGDQVSMRVYRQGTTLHARTVHVLAASRLVHTILGTVQSVGPHSMVVLERGKQYTVLATTSTTVTLNGSRITPTGAQKGDRVRAVGQLQGTTLSATQIVLRRTTVRQKETILRGIVSRISGPLLIITDSNGTQNQVKLGPHVIPLLHGKPATLALFPGVHIIARGHWSGHVLIAASFAVSVRERAISGRLDRVARWFLSLHLHSGEIFTLDLVQGTAISDAGRRASVANLHSGAYIRALGYEEQPNRLRSVTVQVGHPAISISGTVATAGRSPIVQTSQGDRYTLGFNTGSQISSGSAALTLVPTDIPVGTRVSAQGKMQSDGTLLVLRLDIHLTPVTVRGTVTAMSDGQLSLKAGNNATHVRMDSHTVVMQGSHPLTVSDIVVGDDISVHGDSLGAWLAASKIMVHRKLTALDGTVGELTADGFTLVTSDGGHRVIVTSTTVFTGGTTSSFVPGTALHVTGYRRGDGVILATRIKPGKKTRGSGSGTYLVLTTVQTVPDANASQGSARRAISRGRL